MRLVDLPPTFAMFSRETQIVFRKAFGKTFRVESFGAHGHAELDLSKKVAKGNWIWVEPNCLRLFRRRT